MALIRLLKLYKGRAITVLLLGLLTNIMALYVPKFSAHIIDTSEQMPGLNPIILHNLYILLGIALTAFVVSALQIYFSSVFAEKVAFDLRESLINKIGDQTYGYISKETPAKLLTLITSDVDAVKGVVSQGMVTLLGAAVTLLGAIIFLLTINLRLGLYTVSVIPLLVLTFFLVFGNLSKLFNEGQVNLEKINAIINESIVGSALIRVLHARIEELKKFAKMNSKTREVGLGIVKSISALIPAVVFLAHMANLIILYFGGKSVIQGTLTIGEFSAFLSYTTLFIWPLFVLSFVGPMIGRGMVSIKRINEILDSDIPEEAGTYDGELKGDIEFQNVSLVYKDEAGNDRTVLKNISFKIDAVSKTAIIGPTAAGKTQIFYLIAGMVQPTEGKILIDGRPLEEFKNKAFLSKVGLVFQDSILFNSSFRDNISLSDEGEGAGQNSDDSALKLALDTAELTDLIEGLPKGLETNVSERGTSLSGGQKQRLMLARALAIKPSVLLLDDFTARVDRSTEAKILNNVAKNYAGVTLISITQKIEPIQNYDHIIVLMEGEVVADGKHSDLINSSFEYQQIYESQQSTDKADQHKGEVK